MFAIKMWLWQAEGPHTGTGADETFAPGHCLPHLPLTKYEAEKASLPLRHQSVSDSSWDVSFDGPFLGTCVFWGTPSKQINVPSERQHQSKARQDSGTTLKVTFLSLWYLSSHGCNLSRLDNIDQAFLRLSGSDFFDIQEEMAVK